MTDELDEKIIIFNKGVKAGQEHSQPAPETKKFMDDTVKIMTQLQDAVVDIKEDIVGLIDTNKEDHKNILAQVTKTNGTVLDHTNKIQRIEIWQSGRDEKIKLTVKETMTEILKETDKRYAGKISEKIVFTIAGAGLLGIVYTILNHIGLK